MGRCYSLDLRERVSQFVSSGGSRRAAARHFGVSESFAIKLVQHEARSGSPAPVRQGRPPGSGKLAPFDRGFPDCAGRSRARHHHAGTGSSADGPPWRERSARGSFAAALPMRLHI